MKKDIIISIDPGNEDSAWVIYGVDEEILLYKNKEDNFILLDKVDFFINKYNVLNVGIEYPSSYGSAVGQTIFDTCVFIGILIQKFKSYNINIEPVFRKTVKMHLCGSVRANDSNVNTTVRDRFGEDNTAKKPNLFYLNDELKENEGYPYCNGDIWASIALLCYLIEPHDIPMKNEKEQEMKKISKSILNYLKYNESVRN